MNTKEMESAPTRPTNTSPNLRLPRDCQGPGHRLGQRVGGPTISRQVEASLGRQVGWSTEGSGTCEDLDLCCRLASAVAKSLDDEEKEWHDAAESELSEFVAKPGRTTARAVPSTFRPTGSRVKRHTRYQILPE